jgi:hypothetical protein
MDKGKYEVYLKEPLKCAHCGMILANMPKLKQHLMTHEGKKVYYVIHLLLKLKSSMQIHTKIEFDGLRVSFWDQAG